MIEAGIAEALTGVAPPIATSQTLPPACYREQAILEAEMQTIFARSWVNVGRADQWPSGGDYMTVEVADVPLVLVRDADGLLRAFSNVCRHRGARLLSGSGNCRVIRCPFHRWTYALDGHLLTAPRMPENSDFRRADYGLVEGRVAQSDGFVFVCLDDNAPDLQDTLGDFSALHAQWALDGLVTTRRREFEVDCNWKGFLEVFNEYYHLPYVHPNTLSNLYADPDEPTPVRGQYASQFGSTEGTGGLLESEQHLALPTMAGLQGRNRAGVRYSWVFPNLTFAAGTDAVWVYETYPLTARRTRVVMSACFPVETIEQADFESKVSHYYKRLDDAIAEDIPALENQQAGVNSKLARAGRYCPLLEPNVANFAFWYAQQLTP